MTDIEFAAEVAVKVWGMTLLDLAKLRFDEGGYAAPDGLEYIENYRNKLVNSWAGFGRTVEAMFGNPYWEPPSFTTSSVTIQEIIKATHQAALDAVKEKQ